MTSANRRWAVPAIALTLAVALHLTYSPYGYAAVDESMIHAMSRRLLDGQVPHRDFIFSRTALTPILMAPLLGLDLPHLMLLSRFWWWLEMTATAFLWTGILSRSYPALAGARIGVPLSVLSLMLSVHIFPPMAWYTTDGVFLSTLGLWALLRKSRRSKWFGGLLLGLAVLAKQNFVVIPALVLALHQGGWALLAALPVGLYFGGLAAASGLTDFLVQQRGHSDLLNAAVTPYADWATAGQPGFAVWLLATAVPAFQRSRPTLQSWARRLARATLGTLLAVWAWSPALHAELSMGLFWSTALYALAFGRDLPGGWWTAALPLGLAWTSAISNGWQTRALGGAGLVALAAALWLGPEGGVAPSTGGRRMRGVLLWGMAFAALAAHHLVRAETTYADRPRAELVHDLGSVLPGWSGIYTSARTFDYISEAETLASEYGASGHAILPDFPGHWVPPGRRNPLPIDWVYAGDLPLPELVDRVTRVIDANRGRMVILVGRDNAMTFDRLSPAAYRRGQNPVVDYVESRWTRIHRGNHFDVYQ